MPNSFTFVSLLLLAVGAWGQTLKSTPASLTFSHALGSTTLPASQTLAVAPTSGAALNFTAAVAGAGWMVVSPTSAKTNASVKVTVNPTGLAVGNYTATVVLTPAGGTPLNVPVTLTVKAPPATLVATPSPVTVNYTRGAAAPSPVSLSLIGGGALLSYTITITGASWLSATPKTGIIFPAFSAQVALLVDPTGLTPGTYRGTVKIDAPSAANKTSTVNVDLIVNPGAPQLNSVFPAGATQGSAPTTVTLSGDNFYSGTVVKAGSTILATTLLGPSVLQATIPASQLGVSGTLSLTATNPDPGGGTSATIFFSVYPPGPRITSVTNGASFQSGAVAPCEFINIFGTGLGPDSIVTFQPPAAGSSIASALAGTQATINSIDLPLIFISSTQIAAMAPCSLSGASASVTVTYNGTTSQVFLAGVSPTAPGLFALGASGSGAGAVFNLNEASGELTLNTETNAAVRGSTIWLYATGAGQTTPASTDGLIATAELALSAPAATLTVGGVDVAPDYFGPAPGLVQGLLLVKAKVPSTVSAGRAVPVALSLGGLTSQNGVTITVK
ncbi:MAG: hypothetical protein HY821_12900 [Acidobacteria bacterium]|nr:hypothetical protein [Acidobacteriota bacterium]